jgi:hypothetical protein
MHPGEDLRLEQPRLDRRLHLQHQGSVVLLPVVEIDRWTKQLGFDGTAGQQVEQLVPGADPAGITKDRVGLLEHQALSLGKIVAVDRLCA